MRLKKIWNISIKMVNILGHLVPNARTKSTKCYIKIIGNNEYYSSESTIKIIPDTI